MVDQIKSDLMFLAGRLLHRGAQTDEERRAADFIRDRLREHTPEAHVDDFHTIDNYYYLFASYMTEFALVGILCFWFPLVAAAYGAGVLLAYLLEFMGFPIFSRFMPQFDSQNVVARFLGTEPDKIIIVCAHYDSGAATPLTQPRILPWLRPLHTGLILCMILVIATCTAESLAVYLGSVPDLSTLRWAAILCLLSGAATLFWCSSRSEDVRGANSNASGVAALLQVAARMAEVPPENADVWIVATGSNESWMSGMRHLLASHRLSKPQTYVVNLEAVGVGKLHYLEREGLLHACHADPELRAAAAAVSEHHGATAASMRAVPTAAHVAHARGFKTMTVMGLDEQGLPAHWNWFTDRVTEVDEEAIANAAGFVSDILYHMDGRDITADSPQTGRNANDA